ncbi:myc protein [Lucilia sericata]|uniref:myc protein n=1 Tax=Lucilia sericata TaxID=13632 RepID=UPI0018A829A6|nr:myc protein [Lucilia sericata]
MAKLCSPYGTSPISSFLSDLSPNGFSDEFHQIQPDPFDLTFDDLPSICGDIQKIESDNGFSSYGSIMDLDLDVKTEVRNTDLMWWTAPPTTILSTSASSMSSDISSGVSLAAVMGGAASGNSPKTASLQIKVEKEELHAPTVVTAKKVNPMKFKQEIVQIKQEPTDDVEQQLAHHQIPNSKTTPTVAAAQTTSTQQPHPVMLVSTANVANINNIPPGTSLLRKSQQQQQQKKLQQQTRGTLHITKRGDQLLPSANAINTSNHIISTHSTNLFNTSASSNTSSANTSLLYQRPDTPHSLDDDCSTTEFKHNVDLRACVMGSNNISLTPNPLTPDEVFIKSVELELQDTSKKQIDTRLGRNYSFTEVLDLINNSPTNTGEYLKAPTTTSSSSSSGFSSYHSAHNNGSMRSSESDSDEESTMGSSSSSLLDEISYGAGGVSPVSSQSSNISSTQHYMQHRDHSYTRCKDGMDDLSTNLETPSDSEEEIDVVSINDKKLPTNPSDKDRRVLQTKVAHKFNAARIVKNPNGIRTIPPRRGSYEFPYTPASSSPVKSVNNSRFPSPTATPYQNQYTTKYVQQQQQMMAVVVTDSASGAPINILSSNDKSRKRLLANAGQNSNLLNSSELSVSVTSVASMPPTKKHRGKKTKHLVTAVQLPNGILKRHYSVDETADTIEKRNLHNDMERQRRIGLKNLFEALKKQIPSIKDKERAPKVNILREAAKLCEALTREDQQLLEQKAKLKEELRRKQELLAQLRAAQQVD